MKKLTCLLSSVLALGLVFTSCMDVASDDSSSTKTAVTNNKSIGYARISINEDSRTALPTVSLTSLTEIKISVSGDNFTDEFNGDGNGYKYSDLKNLLLPIPYSENPYKFSLTAKSGGIELSSGNVEKSIKFGEETELTFNLKIDSYTETEGTGILRISLNYSGNKDSVKKVETSLYSYEDYLSGNNSDPVLEIKDFTGSVDYSNDKLSKGEYVVEFVFWGDDAKTLKLGSYAVVAVVSSECETIGNYSITTLDSVGSVGYNPNGGSLSSGYTTPISCIKGQAITLPEGTGDSPDISREGYDFIGWYDNEDCEGTKYDNSGNKFVGSEKPVTLYAKWGAIEYTINYLDGDDDATVPADSKTTFTIEEDVELPNATKEGKTFKGWYTKRDEEGILSGKTAGWDKGELPSFLNKETKTVTLYARFDTAKWTVKFLANDGTEIGIDSQEIDHGDKATEPTPPTLDDKAFLCWSTVKDDPDGTETNAYDFEAPVEKDVTLYAVWDEAKTYTVKYLFETLADPTVYEEDPSITADELKGVSGKKTKAVAKEIPGFTAQDVTQKDVEADGTTVVEIKYNRKTITYRFIFDEKDPPETYTVITGKFGASVTAPSVGADGTVVAGKQIRGWDSTPPDEFGSEDKDFKATFN